MRKSLWNWGIWFLILFILDFTVPFFIIDDIPRLSGSFMFWMIWIVVAICSMFAIFLKWREADD